MHLLTFVDDLYEDLELWYPKLRLEEAGYGMRLAAAKLTTYSPVVVDGNLISSRTPKDLAPFAAAMVRFLDEFMPSDRDRSPVAARASGPTVALPPGR